MKAYLECIPCITAQIVRILHNNEPSASRREEIFKKTLLHFHGQELTAHSAPSITQGAHDILKAELGIEDLYLQDKKDCNEKALELYPQALHIYSTSDNKLETAIKLAISANLIDYGALTHFDVEHILNDYMHRPFSINDFVSFKTDIESSKKILYIADNTGEIVFDKILISHLLSLGKQVVVAVKSHPILNDALLQDAHDVGLSELVKVMGSGSRTAGTLLKEATPEFTSTLQEADLIISKGQGNFETLSEETLHQPLYFLLLSKCPHISRELKINKFDLILMDNRNLLRYLS